MPKKTLIRTKLQTKTAVIIAVAVLGVGGLAYAAVSTTTTKVKSPYLGSPSNLVITGEARPGVTNFKGKLPGDIGCADGGYVQFKGITSWIKTRYAQGIKSIVVNSTTAKVYYLVSTTKVDSKTKKSTTTSAVYYDTWTWNKSGGYYKYSGPTKYSGSTPPSSSCNAGSTSKTGTATKNGNTIDKMGKITINPTSVTITTSGKSGSACKTFTINITVNPGYSWTSTDQKNVTVNWDKGSWPTSYGNSNFYVTKQSSSGLSATYCITALKSWPGVSSSNPYTATVTARIKVNGSYITNGTVKAKILGVPKK